jgi:NADPH:quinone reductase-like Zn-dependent oxidoreductase
MKPVIDRAFPLDASPGAHHYMETNRWKGKSVVTV